MLVEVYFKGEDDHQLVIVPENASVIDISEVLNDMYGHDNWEYFLNVE